MGKARPMTEITFSTDSNTLPDGDGSGGGWLLMFMLMLMVGLGLVGYMQRHWENKSNDKDKDNVKDGPTPLSSLSHTHIYLRW